MNDRAALGPQPRDLGAPPRLTVSTLAGAGVAGGSNGSSMAALFNAPVGVAVDATGNLYVVDRNNDKVRKITAAGAVSTLAGSGLPGSADGPGAMASFNDPFGVAVDASGNVYVGDLDNHKVRKITAAGVVSTLAGSGVAGSADGPGPAASFNFLTGVAVDGSGNVYVADSLNHKIRKITAAGVVSTLAGAGVAGCADGPGATASFHFPIGVAVDGAGTVYVCDVTSNKIRKITTAGVVSTLAGSGAMGCADGSATQASFNQPFGVAVDGSGTVYVVERNNNKVRTITPAGVVSTLAGSGAPGRANGPAMVASFCRPQGVAVDGRGNVYVGDTDNHTIRKITQG